MPTYAQISSINDILVEDFDNDGVTEVLLVGNLYASEVETTRNDASYGCLLTFDKNGENMMAIRPAESGLFSMGDVKKVGKININGQQCVITATNNGPISIHRY